MARPNLIAAKHAAPDPPPTQVAHPWRATARTMLAAAWGIIPLLPFIAREAGVETVPVVAGVLVIAGTVTRIFSDPAVDAWVRRFAPILATVPKHPLDRKDTE